MCTGSTIRSKLMVRVSLLARDCMASAKRACATTITRADSSGMPDRMHPFFDEQCISEDLVYIPSVIQVLCGKALRDSKVPPPSHAGFERSDLSQANRSRAAHLDSGCQLKNPTISHERRMANSPHFHRCRSFWVPLREIDLSRLSSYVRNLSCGPFPGSSLGLRRLILMPWAHRSAIWLAGSSPSSPELGPVRLPGCPAHARVGSVPSCVFCGAPSLSASSPLSTPSLRGSTDVSAREDLRGRIPESADCAACRRRLSGMPCRSSFS